MDRFMRGLVAGFIGGITMNLWSLIATVILKLDILRFIDWAGIMLYGEPPQNYLEGAFAFLIQLMFTGMLGILLALLYERFTSRHYLVKGAFYGIITGFIIYAIPTLLQMPYLSKATFTTVISNHVGGLIFGLTTALMLNWLDTTPRTKV